MDQAVESRLRDAGARQELPPLLACQLAELRLEPRGEGHDLCLFMVRLHRGLQLVEPFAPARCEVVFVDVGGVENRLRGEQSQRAEELDRIGEEDELELGLLVARARGLPRLVEAALDAGEIGERQLARDHVVIAHRIDRPHDVHHVGVFEAADDVHDRVHFADVRQELVAEPLALRGTLHQPGDVDEFDDGGNLTLWLDDVVQRFKPWVRHLDDADVRLDRAEGIVLRRRGLGGRQRVEQRRLADIGKSHDAESQHQALSHCATASIIWGMSACTSSSCTGSNGAST